MGKKRASNMKVVCNRGTTTLFTGGIEVTYNPTFKLITVNDMVKPPGVRKNHKKIIKINGKKRGYAEFHSGLIPLSKYTLKGNSLFIKVKQWIRRNLGYLCRPYEKGYIFINLCKFRYIVTTAYTQAGFITCEVYSLDEGVPIGRFSFNSEFTEVYAAANVEGVNMTLQVILGYVADSEVYNLVVSSLDRTINIHLSK